MKIFGKNFTTKKDLRKEIADLEKVIDEQEEVIEAAFDAFPFYMGQVVYDVALKNDKGRYTKINPSLEYSTITEVTVNDKNYFSLKKRLDNNDVFHQREDAEEYLKSICK